MTSASADPRSVERRAANALEDSAILWEADASAVHFSFVSESAKAVLGCSPEEWQAESRFLQKHVPPDDWPRLLETMFEAAAERRLRTCEHRMLRADGSTLWAHTSVRPADGADESILLSGMTVDVTDVKQGEQRLHREEAMLRRLIETLRGCAVFRLSSSGAIESWMPEARRLTGYCREVIIGEPFSRLFSTDDRRKNTPEELLRKADETQEASFEGCFTRADDSTFWGSLTLAAASGAATTDRGYSVLLGDLTERHERERDLSRRFEGLELLVQNASEHGLWMTSRDGLVESWNRGAQRLTGYRAHEIVGAPVATLFSADEIKRGTVDRLLEEAGRAGAARHEGWLVRKSGGRSWARVFVGAADNERDELRGFAFVAHDITISKRKEDALRANEEHFRLLVDSVRDYAIFMLSVDGAVATWNRGAQRLKGWTSQEIIGSPLSRFFPPEEVEKGTPARLVEQATLDGHAQYEGWLVRRKGDRFWATIQLDTIEDEDGRIRGFSNISRDLTAQRRAEAALRESEERLRMLVDSVQDYAVFMISPEGTVMSWSRGAERLEGYRADEILGAPISRSFPAEERMKGTVERLLERAKAEGRGGYEGWLVRKDGSTFWGDITLCAVRDADSQLRGFSIVVGDRTERMRSERAQAFLAEVGQVLAGSLDYRTTIDKVAELAIRELAECSIVAIEINGSIEPVAVAHDNVRMRRTIEASLAALPREARVPSRLAAAIRSGVSQLHPDIPLGDWFRDELGVTACMCVPLIARGKAFGAIALLSTGTRGYELRDLALADELARRAGLAIEAARLYEEAQRAIRTREEVLTIVSHDLRGPLSTILLGAQHLQRECAPEDPAATTLARIARSAERTTRMIHDLLDFSSIEAGRLTLDLRDCSAREIAREVVEMYMPIAADKGIELVDETGTLDAWLRCDPSRIVQVLSNLLGNAVKLTPAGAAVTLAATLTEDGRAVSFHVIDSGPGIPDDHVPHVFDRYWQAKRRSGAGVGLGLAIAKGLVEAHGGKIGLTTKAGEGCTFSVTLPAAGPVQRESQT